MGRGYDLYPRSMSGIIEPGHDNVPEYCRRSFGFHEVSGGIRGRLPCGSPFQVAAADLSVPWLSQEPNSSTEDGARNGQKSHGIGDWLLSVFGRRGDARAG